MVHPLHHRTLSDAATADAAAALWRARTTGVQLEALALEQAPSTIADAVAIQVETQRLAGPTAGWKIAGTSPGSQAILGSDRPMAAPLPRRFRHDDGGTVPAGLCLGLVEAEIAFVLADDIDRVPAEGDLHRIVASTHLALELPDARHRDIRAVGALANLADLALGGRYVIGPEIGSLSERDLAEQQARILVNDREVAAGAGRAVLGSPWRALGWLARELVSQDRKLRAGEVVLTGSITAPPSVAAGDHIRAEFPGVGQVSATLAPDPITDPVPAETATTATTASA